MQQSTGIKVPTLYAPSFTTTLPDIILLSKSIFPVKAQAAGKSRYRCKERCGYTITTITLTSRGLSSPGYFCGVWEQDIIDFWCIDGDRASLPKLSLAIRHRATVERRYAGFRAPQPPATRSRLNAWRGYDVRIMPSYTKPSPVFTHGDLDPSNILVQDDGTVVLIDWQRSGPVP